MARGGPVLGKIEEAFLETLVHGDTFLFAGKVLRFEGIRENECFVSNAPGKDAKVPYYGGGKFPLSTYLADQVRGMLADPKRWKALPEQVADWLRLQAEFSVLPKRGDLLVETFPRGERFYMVAYPFEGRLAHQTLGMLLTRRLERFGARPLGFVATDYVLGVWALGDMGHMFKSGKPSLGELFDEDMLGDDLDAWLADSWMLKRTFRACAQISGLIEKRYPGQEKSGRQVTVSADLIYDVLRTHEPDHILLQATRADAASGLLDVRRLADMLSRIKGRIVHKDLDRISPLAVPIMLEVGPRAGRRRGGRLASVGGGGSDRRGDGQTEGEVEGAVRGAEPIFLPGAAQRGNRGRRRGGALRPPRRALFPGARPALRLRPASGKGLVAGAARHAGAALRHGGDAAEAPGGRSTTTGRRSSSASATAFMTARAHRACPSRMRLDLSAMMAGRDWFWVAGNHDPQPPAGLPGDTVEALAVGALMFRHEPSAKSPEGEIAGICIPARASCSAAARCAAAASPPTASASSCRPSAPIRVRSTCSTAPMPGCSGATG